MKKTEEVQSEEAYSSKTLLNRLSMTSISAARRLAGAAEYHCGGDSTGKPDDLARSNVQKGPVRRQSCDLSLQEHTIRV